MELREYCTYRIERINSSELDTSNYISTENILPNKGGIANATSIPSGNVVRYDKGNILISNIRPYFKKIWLADKSGGCSADVLCIEANDNISSKYLYYLLSQQSFFDYVMAGAKGCKMPRGDKNHIMEWEVNIPNLTEQKRIADILSSIDNKIELNRRINDNLEQQIKLLFKSWFIENKSDSWMETPFSEVVFFQEGPGIRNWQYVANNGVRFINIRCIIDGDISTQNANMISEDEACGKYSHFMLQPMDIVMSCSGTLGRYAIVRHEHLPLCLNTSVIRFRPLQSSDDYSFIYGYLSSSEFLNKQIEMACGSVQANFGPTHLKQITISLPPKDSRKNFNNIVMPIIKTILKNRAEINKLSDLRDTLLPRLMSGELKINDLNC